MKFFRPSHRLFTKTSQLGFFWTLPRQLEIGKPIAVAVVDLHDLQTFTEINLLRRTMVVKDGVAPIEWIDTRQLEGAFLEEKAFKIQKFKQQPRNVYFQTVHHIQLGELDLHMHRLTEAKSEFEGALNLADGESDARKKTYLRLHALVNLVSLKQHDGQYREAFEWMKRIYQEGAEAFGGHDLLLQPIAYCWMVSAIPCGEFAHALSLVDAMMRVERITDRYQRLQSCKAAILRLDNQPEEAGRLYLDCIARREVDSVECAIEYANLGWTHFQMGNIHEASKNLENARRIFHKCCGKEHFFTHLLNHFIKQNLHVTSRRMEAAESELSNPKRRIGLHH